MRWFDAANLSKCFVQICELKQGFLWIILIIKKSWKVGSTVHSHSAILCRAESGLAAASHWPEQICLSGDVGNGLGSPAQPCETLWFMSSDVPQGDSISGHPLLLETASKS